MKYCKFLEAKALALPAPLRQACLDYRSLKRIIKPLRMRAKNAFFPQDYSPIGADGSSLLVPEFPGLVKERLLSLHNAVSTFLESLDEQVLKMNDVYVSQVEEIRNVRQAHEADRLQAAAEGRTLSPEDESRRSRALLERIVELEGFALINYTGVVKILKKMEKTTNLDIRDAYLYRMALLPFSKNLALAELKSKLLAELSTANVALSTEPDEAAAKKPRLQHEDVAVILSAATAATGPSAPSGRSSYFKHVPDRKTRLAIPLGAVGASQRIVVTVTGALGTDILGCLVSVLAKYKSAIHDLSLARVHHAMTVGALVSLQTDDVDMFRELIEAAARLEAIVNFELPSNEARSATGSPADVSTSAVVQSAPEHVLTLASSSGVSASALADVARYFASSSVSVQGARCLTSDGCRALEMRLAVPPTLPLGELDRALRDLSAAHGVDIHLQAESVTRRHKRLVVFDMDSTLIQQECIDELAELAGVQEEVSRITAEAMAGQLDFQWSLRKRVALLEGHPATFLETVRSRVTFNEGARELCRALKRLGCVLAVVSGGFRPIASYVQAELGLDYMFANELGVTEDGRFTGTVVGDIVDAARKAEILRALAAQHGIDDAQTVAVGDGANDLVMLAAAGMGVAYRAKPRVQEAAQFRVNDPSLATLLFSFGLTDTDIAALLSAK